MANDSTIVFATQADYELRYGDVADTARLDALLEDASTMMLASYESYYGAPYETGAHDVFDRSACAVCCAVAHRSLSVPAGFEGASQYSQTAGSYNASVSFSNPTGDMYLTKTDLKRLGLTGQAIGVIMPIMPKCGDE